MRSPEGSRGRRISGGGGTSDPRETPGATEGGGPIATATVGKAQQGMPDAEAIRLASKGDHDAFRVLVERYQARAYRLALRVLRDEDAARDAVQDALIKAYTSLPKFEGRSSFYTWLYRLVMNQCLDHKRRDRSDRHVEWEDGDPIEAAGAQMPPPEVAGVRFAPAAEVMRKELRRQVGAAIEQLPDDSRQTLLLREVEGLAYAEIAEVLGIPKGTVMSRLHYARKRVQQLLLEAGVVEAAEDAEGGAS